MRRRQRALAKVILPIAVVTPTTALSVPATFAPPVTYQLGAGFQSPSGLGIHDVNADGNLDVVIGALDINSFSVFPGAGNGTLGPATTVSTTNAAAPSSAYRPRTVAIGDVNNDGRADLYFAGYGVNDNIVSLNQSSGGVLGFGTPAYISAVQAPGTPALGDLNEDGNLDVVQPGYNGGNGNANTVLTRMGNGDGTFQASSQLFTNPLPGEGSNVAAIADVNGDGNLDVLAGVNAIGGGSPRQGAVMTALGNGDGTFQAPAGVALVGATANPQSLLVLDINGDGDLDVLTGNGSSVSTLLGDGTGTFATGTADSNLVGYSVAGADVNGDGLTDVALADWYGDRVSIALGNGDGTFDPPSFIAMPAGSSPYGLAIADLNGDGLRDIVVGTYAGGTPSGGTLSVLLNTTVAAAPTITGVTPATGSTAGGTSVTITGTGFTGATAVTFGGVNATSFTVNSATGITAVAPPGAAGTVAIQVTTANGTGTGAGLFTYSPATTPSGDEPAGSTPTAGAQAASAATPRPVRVGRISMSRPRGTPGGIIRSTGAVPVGADRIVQIASKPASETTRTLFAGTSKATMQARCGISGGAGGRRFTCTLRVPPGTWTITTRALAGSTAIATSVNRVRVKPRPFLPVTG